MDIKNLTIKKASEMLKAGGITSVDLVASCLKNIKEKNKELNIFLEVFSDALDQAKKADEIIKSGKGNNLTGIPIAIKDNILITGKKVSAGSKMLENYTASYDAFVIKKLKEAGAVLIGRTNMDEFAMGSSTETSAFGPVKNPIDTERVPGGSSGGSAAAVASGMCLGALGSDTGGSIRQPASFCGIVGMKPSYGVVSRSGLIALTSSLDQIGPMAKNSEDAKIIFDCIVGKDELDATSIELPPRPSDTPPYQGGDRKSPRLAKEGVGGGKIIGVPRDWLKEGIDKEVLENFENSLKKLEKFGYQIKDISLPYSKYALAVYYIITPAEVSTNLSRLDGVRYGLRKEGENVFDTYSKSRSAGFGIETRRRIILGTYVLSHGYYDAYYNKAWKVRREIEKEYQNIFKEVDFVATPTTPTTAFKFGEKSDPIQMYLSDILTVPANIAGVCSISIPNGKVKIENDLPTGIQFTGAFGKDESLFAIEKDLRENI
ncbi:MAG: Asp-tRNA(Asn)/Glu-tRNA(Gln) amidotransferase subunit GatA [Patescibacteria group bacterium]